MSSTSTTWTTQGNTKAGATSTSTDSLTTGTLTADTIQLSSNVIKASDGGSTITLDTSDNVTIAGDLTVTGGKMTFGNSEYISNESDNHVYISNASGSINLSVNPKVTSAGAGDTCTLSLPTYHDDADSIIWFPHASSGAQGFFIARDATNNDLCIGNGANPVSWTGAAGTHITIEQNGNVAFEHGDVSTAGDFVMEGDDDDFTILGGSNQDNATSGTVSTVGGYVRVKIGANTRYIQLYNNPPGGG